MTGIEPASPAWEAGVLPMNYICTEIRYSDSIAHIFFICKRKLQVFQNLSPGRPGYRTVCFLPLYVRGASDVPRKDAPG